MYEKSAKITQMHPGPDHGGESECHNAPVACPHLYIRFLESAVGAYSDTSKHEESDSIVGSEK